MVTLGHLDASQELRFTSALMTHRDCAKQSILWHHRRWLLRFLYQRGSSGDGIEAKDDIVDEDFLINHYIPTEIIASELEISSKASEIYPRNYFAWSHRFRCLLALTKTAQVTHSSHSLDLIKQESLWIRQWIERHISDYSAMQYHQQLSTAIQQLDPEIQLVLSGTSPSDTPRSLALSLVQTYPNHEALWIYLRNSIELQAPSASTDPVVETFIRDTLAEASQLDPGTIQRRLAFRLALGSTLGVGSCSSCAHQSN